MYKLKIKTVNLIISVAGSKGDYAENFSDYSVS